MDNSGYPSQALYGITNEDKSRGGNIAQLNFYPADPIRMVLQQSIQEDPGERSGLGGGRNPAFPAVIE